MLDKVDILAAAKGLAAAWAPDTVAAYNGHHVQVLRVEGEYVWHAHDRTDDLFIALDDTVWVDLRERTVELRRGELFVVPVGTEHRLRAAEGRPAHVLCIEHLGDVPEELRLPSLEGPLAS